MVSNNGLALLFKYVCRIYSCSINSPWPLFCHRRRSYPPSTDRHTHSLQSICKNVDSLVILNLWDFNMAMRCESFSVKAEDVQKKTETWKDAGREAAQGCSSWKYGNYFPITLHTSHISLLQWVNNATGSVSIMVSDYLMVPHLVLELIQICWQLWVQLCYIFCCGSSSMFWSNLNFWLAFFGHANA